MTSPRIFPSPSAMPGRLETYTKTDQDQFSQELQLLGSADRLKYVGGLYYFNENGDQKERQYLDRASGR